MNKVLNINLGGMPFVIDMKAYQQLEDYLKAIENHFADSEGFEEITSDIEARLGELFQEALGKREIITIKDVNDAIAVMGVPAEFDGASSSDGKTGGGDQRKYHTGKKLFRDVENQKVAGVAAGLTAYFGLDDVVWMRLAFVVAFFAGFGVILYIILWILTPEALTSADRLAMRGQKVDINSMAKVIEDQITNIADSIEDFATQKKKK